MSLMCLVLENKDHNHDVSIELKSNHTYLFNQIPAVSGHARRLLSHSPARLDACTRGERESLDLVVK